MAGRLWRGALPLFPATEQFWRGGRKDEHRCRMVCLAPKLVPAPISASSSLTRRGVGGAGPGRARLLHVGSGPRRLRLPLPTRSAAALGSLCAPVPHVTWAAAGRSRGASDLLRAARLAPVCGKAPGKALARVRQRLVLGFGDRIGGTARTEAAAALRLDRAFLRSSVDVQRVIRGPGFS